MTPACLCLRQALGSGLGLLPSVTPTWTPTMDSHNLWKEARRTGGLLTALLGV